MTSINQATIESAALERFGELGYAVAEFNGSGSHFLRKTILAAQIQ